MGKALFFWQEQGNQPEKASGTYGPYAEQSHRRDDVAACQILANYYVQARYRIGHKTGRVSRGL